MSFRDAKEFRGDLTLTNRTISFIGETVLLSNIAKFRQCQILRAYRFSIVHMVIAAIIIFIFYNRMYWGLLFVLPAAWVLYTGVSERLKPNLYALSLELNSGKTYDFSSTDEEGIRRLYSKLKELMNDNSDRQINYNYHFEGGKVVLNSGDTYNVNNSQVGAVGRNASAEANFNNNN